MKLNWILLWHKVRLTRFDMLVSASIALVAVLLIVLGAAASDGHNAAVKASLLTTVSGAVQSWLLWLDSFEITNAAVTFMFWGFVGLVAYSSISVLSSISEEVKYERDLSTDEYVRPAQKTKGDIVRAELVDMVVRAIGGVSFALSLATGFFVLLPALNIQVKSAVLQPDLLAWVGVMAASVLCTLGIGLVVIGARILLYHQTLLDG